MAALKGNLEICEAILEKSVDNSPRSNNGNTPLHFAAKQGHKEVCELFLQYVTEKNPRNNQGKTPCQLARKSKGKKSKDIVSLFEMINVSK